MEKIQEESGNDFEKEIESQDSNYEYQFQPFRRQFKQPSQLVSQVGNAIEPPLGIDERETVDTITTADGTLKITKSIRKLSDTDPQLGQSNISGHQYREIKEKTGDGLKAISDLKTESIEGENGTRINRKVSTFSVVKKSSSGDKNVSSLDDFLKSNNASSILANTEMDLKSSADRFPKFVPMQTPNESFGYKTNMVITPQKADKKKEIIAPTFAYELDNVQIKKGESAFFEGTINGTPPFETIWYFGGKLLDLNNNTETSMRDDYTEYGITGLVDYKISLKIRNCAHQNIGEYTLNVKNEAGAAISSAHIILDGLCFFSLQTQT
jgi:hypothetical protein